MCACVCMCDCFLWAYMLVCKWVHVPVRNHHHHHYDPLHFIIIILYSSSNYNNTHFVIIVIIIIVFITDTNVIVISQGEFQTIFSLVHLKIYKLIKLSTEWSDCRIRINSKFKNESQWTRMMTYSSFSSTAADPGFLQRGWGWGRKEEVAAPNRTNFTDD